jgi:hypothetical protein
MVMWRSSSLAGMWYEKTETKMAEVEHGTNNHIVFLVVCLQRIRMYIHRNMRHCGKLAGEGRERYCRRATASFLFYNTLPHLLLTWCTHAIPWVVNDAQPLIFPSMLPLFFRVVVPPLRNHWGYALRKIHVWLCSRSNWVSTWVLHQYWPYNLFMISFPAAWINVHCIKYKYKHK